MREIKFRGKRVIDGEWEYGYYAEIPTRFESDGLPYDYRSFILTLNRLDHNPVLVDPENVSQYTGLKDINGAEIYEGDICRNGYSGPYGDFFENNVVVYFDKDTCFGLQNRHNPKQYKRITTRMIKENNIEVIGNIYEPPNQ